MSSTQLHGPEPSKRPSQWCGYGIRRRRKHILSEVEKINLWKSVDLYFKFAPDILDTKHENNVEIYMSTIERNGTDRVAFPAPPHDAEYHNYIEAGRI